MQPSHCTVGRFRSHLWRILALCLLVSNAPQASSERENPLKGKLAERVAVTLMLLDVDVSDKSGHAIRGLTKKDFSVRLDGAAWPIYSVDDLCAAPEPGTAAAGPSPATTANTPRHGESAGGAEPVRYVIYLDFSQLQTDGRSRALKEAARWVLEKMQPGDQVMVAAYATAANARALIPFTGDRDKLVKVIGQAGKDPTLVDPFPTYLLERGLECKAALKERPPRPVVCTALASDEYHHGRRSMMALKIFLGSLDHLPGRKAILLFHQNGNLFPSRFYAGLLRDRDHVRLLEQIGAEATSSHAVIYAAYTGDMQLLDEQTRQAVNWGVNLADFTGGGYNRGPSDLSRLVDEARDHRSCIYRIGLEPPVERRSTVYRATVRVGGQSVSFDYRVQYLTPSDQWMRKARSVLAHPEESRDLIVTAGVVPVRLSRQRWDLRVGVALNIASIAMLPSAAGRQGSWEVGGLLVRDDGKETWEMLGISRIHAGSGSGAGAWVVHERGFSSMAPGKYHFMAFVRDTEANVFGGAETTLELPSGKTRAIVGPILMRPDREQVVSTLPLFRTGSTEPASSARVTTGPIPAGDSMVRAGESLQIDTWVCPGPAVSPGRGLPRPEPQSIKTQRYVSARGVPVFRFEEITPEPAGACFVVSDRIERWLPSPGQHAYHLRWVTSDGAEIASTALPFQVVP